MLKKLNFEDFAVLRGPFESGRQSPSSLSAALILSIFMQALFIFLEKYIGNYSIYPHTERIFNIHLWLSIILAVLSIIYSIPVIYMRSQKIQYLLTISVSQNLGSVSIYILILFMLGAEAETFQMDSNEIVTCMYVILLLGIIVFILTSIRFYILLKKGQYRKGSKKDKLRAKFEKKSLVPVAIIGSTGLVFIIQFLIRTFGIQDFQLIIMISLATLIFLTMLFVLPEQLVLLYCKFRFKSFNFDRRGNLYFIDNDLEKSAKVK
ncbi:hypothetical protein [Pueribacillus sp. YX66]|uniref:hypothetical protein n=1 Tax=Pueribacillus sp. YX66 TaxID=3229242 RepID=UPI00358D6764